MKRNGFTLIELIVTLVVMGVAAAFVIPGFKDVARSNRMAGNTNDFVTALSLARSTAVTRGRRATVCQSDQFDPSQAGSRSCTGGTGWDLGFIVWTDTNGDGNTQSDEVIRVFQAFDDNDGINDVSFAPKDGTTNRIDFLASGRIDSAADLVFRLQPGDCGGEAFARVISIPIGGRPSLKSNQACI